MENTNGEGERVMVSSSTEEIREEQRKNVLDPTDCPVCEGGFRVSTCMDCRGAGGDCVTCGGSGAWKEHCTLCKGLGILERAYARLLDAVRANAHRMADEHPRAVKGADYGLDPRVPTYTEQHPGITDSSLLCYWSFRDQLKREKVEVHGVPGSGQKVVMVGSWFQLVLTGVTWGYGGEGPNGLAVMLTDLGKFKTLEEAKRWVEKQGQNKVWQAD